MKSLIEIKQEVIDVYGILDPHFLLINSCESNNIDGAIFAIKNLQCKQSDYYFSLCAQYDSLDVFKYLLTRMDLHDINIILKSAVFNNNIEFVEFLFTLKYTINFNNSYYIRTSCDERNFEMFKLLHENGFDIHFNNELPLIMSINNSQFKMIKYIIKDGIKINTNMHELICNASYYNNLDIIKFLIEHGADIRYDNDRSLEIAASCKNFNIAQFYIENGCDINNIEKSYKSHRNL